MSTPTPARPTHARRIAALAVRVGVVAALSALFAPAISPAATFLEPRRLPWSPTRLQAKPSAINVMCFYDLDADGTRDPDEQGLEYYNFRLLGRDGGIVRTSMTHHGRITFGALRPGSYTFVQNHPYGPAGWFTTTGNERFALSVRERERRQVAVGTALSDSGVLQPRDWWTAYPSLIPDRALDDVNALSPFVAEPFASEEELAAFIGEAPGQGRDELAREMAHFAVAFDRLAGSPRCGVRVNGEWTEAGALLEQASVAWNTGDPAEIDAARATISALITGPVAFVPLGAPVPIY